MRVNFWRLWVFNNPQWDPRTFDFDRDIALADGQVGKLVDQKNTDLSAFKAHGAVGDVIGQFLGADGRPVASEVNQRTLGLRIEDLRGREVVAVAGGGEKRDAILATLASGIVTGLIIDEATARLVLAAADRPAARPPRGNARQRPSQATG